jgi:hypothetical protein
MNSWIAHLVASKCLNSSIIMKWVSGLSAWCLHAPLVKLLRLSEEREVEARVVCMINTGWGTWSNTYWAWGTVVRWTLDLEEQGAGWHQGENPKLTWVGNWGTKVHPISLLCWTCSSAVRHVLDPKKKWLAPKSKKKEKCYEMGCLPWALSCYVFSQTKISEKRQKKEKDNNK